MTSWPPAIRTQFLLQQFQAQRMGYRNMYPQAAFSIILSNGVRAGRIVVSRSDAEIRLVDIALLPTFRNKGMGTQLLSDLRSDAQRLRIPVCLSVLRDNRAQKLYRSLGFTETGTDDTRIHMEWHPV